MVDIVHRFSDLTRMYPRFFAAKTRGVCLDVALSFINLLEQVYLFSVIKFEEVRSARLGIVIAS